MSLRCGNISGLYPESKRYRNRRRSPKWRHEFHAICTSFRKQTFLFWGIVGTTSGISSADYTSAEISCKAGERMHLRRLCHMFPLYRPSFHVPTPLAHSFVSRIANHVVDLLQLCLQSIRKHDCMDPPESASASGSSYYRVPWLRHNDVVVCLLCASRLGRSQQFSQGDGRV